MSHNLLHNIIPGAIALAIILGGILWCIVADIRRQAGEAPLRLRLDRPVKSPPVAPVSAARLSVDA